MYSTFYQYLILHKQLCLPGIGTIQLQKSSSGFDFGDKCFTAPAYYFKMDSRKQSPSKKLYEWISKARNISDWEAIRLVNDFSFDLKNQLSTTGEVSWKNVGRFLRDEKGNIMLDSAFMKAESELPVIAEKVIREKAGHNILVGDNIKTAIEMEETLTETIPNKDYGWIIAIIAIVLSIMIVGIYLSENGLALSSLGNQQIIHTR